MEVESLAASKSELSEDSGLRSRRDSTSSETSGQRRSERYNRRKQQQLSLRGGDPTRTRLSRAKSLTSCSGTDSMELACSTLMSDSQLGESMRNLGIIGEDDEASFEEVDEAQKSNSLPSNMKLGLGAGTTLIRKRSSKKLFRRPEGSGSIEEREEDSEWTNSTTESRSEKAGT